MNRKTCRCYPSHRVKPLIVLLILLSSLLCIAGCLTERGEGTRDSSQKGFETEPVPGPGAGGERYAVCIGVSDYQNLPDLRFAHLDAEDVYDFLISDAGGYDLDHCMLLCDTNARDGRVLKKDMESLFTTWMARVQPEDSVFIFYSGHGLPRGRDGAFMAGWDTDPDDLYPTAIPMDRMREYLEEHIAADRVVVVLDTCFSGALRGKTYLPGGQRTGAFDESNLDRVVEGTGRIILTASTGSQAAHESEDLRHGIFTYCLLNGLKGQADQDRDSRVTLSELWLYLQREVRQEAGRRNFRQNPVRKGVQTGEIVLAHSRNPRSPAPAPENAQSSEAVALLLEAARLRDLGLYDRAVEQFRRARPLVSFEQRSHLEAIIEECMKAARAAESAELDTASQGTGSDEVATELAGTLAEADYLAGRKAMAEGLWNVALAYFESALEKSPEAKRALIEAGIESCRLEKKADEQYLEIDKLFQEAEDEPSQIAYRQVLEKIRLLEELGKGENYRNLGFIRMRAEEEDTSDESRKYFGIAQRHRDAGHWLEAMDWFERAKNGAGGCYPGEIEDNLIYCGVSLGREITQHRIAAQDALEQGQFVETEKHCKAWLALDPGSEEALVLMLKAVTGHGQALFNEGSYGLCQDYARQALDTWPDDEFLQALAVRAEEENIPGDARAAWERAKEAEEEEDWAALADALTEGLMLEPGKGFNEHYRNLARPWLVEAKGKAYARFNDEVLQAIKQGEYGKALGFIDKALLYRPESEALEALRKEIEPKALELDEARFRSAVDREKMESVHTFTTARTNAQVQAVIRAMAGYRAYLESFPEGRRSMEARSALKRLEQLKQGYPVVKGFRFLRVETFTCGGAVNTTGIYLHEKTGLEFVLVPGGEFLMGSLVNESGRYQNEGPQRTVKVKSFLLCRTECTRAGWAHSVSENRKRSNDDDMPVAERNWYDCVDWCKKAGLRLPTEAEWEYACRAGTRTAFCHGDSAADLSSYAWYIANSINRAHPVARKNPNAFGLFDMHGNLWEWCQDTYKTADSSSGADTYALKTSGRTSRVTRGGGWNFHARFCRSAYRSGDFPHERSSLLGFRPAFTLP